MGIIVTLISSSGLPSRIFQVVRESVPSSCGTSHMMQVYSYVDMKSIFDLFYD